MRDTSEFMELGKEFFLLYSTIHESPLHKLTTSLTRLSFLLNEQRNDDGIFCAKKWCPSDYNTIRCSVARVTVYEVQHHFSEKFLDRGKEVELPLFLPPCVFCPTTAISKTSVGEYQFTIPVGTMLVIPKEISSSFNQCIMPLFFIPVDLRIQHDHHHHRRRESTCTSCTSVGTTKRRFSWPGHAG